MRARRARQRGRGRRGGRAPRLRGRMRKRGPSGGGTLRTKSPQHGQRPSLEMGAVASARSHWPRASQSGLMHCTVKPGKYCIDFLPLASERRGCGVAQHEIPLGWPKKICWREFWGQKAVVSREKGTRYCGWVAELWKCRSAQIFCSNVWHA